MHQTTIGFQQLAVHLEEDVLPDLGPPSAVNSPSAPNTGAGAGVRHQGIRQVGWVHRGRFGSGM